MTTDLGSKFKGDTIYWKVTVKDKTNTPIDITGYKIRWQLEDGDGHILKGATINSGGSADQCSYVDAPNGQFQIKIAKTLTASFGDKVTLTAVVVDLNDDLFTVEHANLTLKDQSLTWETPS